MGTSIHGLLNLRAFLLFFLVFFVLVLFDLEFPAHSFVSLLKQVVGGRDMVMFICLDVLLGILFVESELLK